MFCPYNISSQNRLRWGFKLGLMISIKWMCFKGVAVFCQLKQWQVHTLISWKPIRFTIDNTQLLLMPWFRNYHSARQCFSLTIHQAKIGSSGLWSYKLGVYLKLSLMLSIKWMGYKEVDVLCEWGAYCLHKVDIKCGSLTEYKTHKG